MQHLPVCTPVYCQRSAHGCIQDHDQWLLVQAVQEKKSQQQVLARVVAALQHSKLAAALAAWREAASTAAHQRQLIGSSLAKLLHSNLARSWQLWQDAVLESRQLHQVPSTCSAPALPIMFRACASQPLRQDVPGQATYWCT